MVLGFKPLAFAPVCFMLFLSLLFVLINSLVMMMMMMMIYTAAESNAEID